MESGPVAEHTLYFAMHKYRFLHVLIPLFLLISSSTWGSCDLPRSITAMPSIEHGDPVDVTVGVYVLDTISINDVEQSVVLDFVQTYRWNDPRLSAESLGFSLEGCNLSLSDIWSPRITLINARSFQQRTQQLQVNDKGDVTVYERITATITETFDLRRFPFDKQNVSLDYFSAFGPDTVNFVLDERKIGKFRDFSIAGWSFEGTSVSKSVRSLELIERPVVGFSADLLFSRHLGFYLWKVFIPLAFIVFMAWTVFWIDPAEFGTQIGISTSSVITLVAFQLGLVSLLPKIAYTTEVDVYILGCSGLIFIALGEAIITARLAHIGKHALSLMIDRVMRWAYPLTYLCLCLLIRW
jgi:hypothetical protein